MNDLERCLRVLKDSNVQFGNERAMQRDVAKLLKKAEIAHEEEVRLSAGDRIDFVAGDDRTVGIELKVNGTFPRVARQLLRYCEHESIGSLILVTTCPTHLKLRNMPNGRGIPVHVLFMAFNAI